MTPQQKNSILRDIHGAATLIASAQRSLRAIPKPWARVIVQAIEVSRLALGAYAKQVDSMPTTREPS